MIFDHIKNKERYKYDQKLYDALCYIDAHKDDEFPAERKVLAGIAKYLTLKTKPEQDAAFEVHHLQGDVQYMVSGTEGVQTMDFDCGTPTGEFSEEKDYGEFTGEPDGTYWLKPGYFMAVMPYEIHKTGIMYKEPGTVRKIVYKF